MNMSAAKICVFISFFVTFIVTSQLLVNKLAMILYIYIQILY